MSATCGFHGIMRSPSSLCSPFPGEPSTTWREKLCYLCLLTALPTGHPSRRYSFLKHQGFSRGKQPTFIGFAVSAFISSLVFRGMYLHTVFADAQICGRAEWESSKAALSCEAVLQAAEALSFFEHCLQRQQLLGLFRAWVNSWGSFSPGSVHMVSFVPIQCLCWHLVPCCHVKGRGRWVSGSGTVSCHSKLKELIAVCDRSCSHVPLVADVARCCLRISSVEF